MQFPLTLDVLLERARKLFGPKEIVWRMPDHSLRRYTYADFHRRASALACALVSAGLQPGERVASLIWNHSEHLEAYFGVPSAGGILLTLNLRLHKDELAYIANHAQPRFLIVDDVLLPLYEAIRPQARLERVFVIPYSGRAIPTDQAELEDYESFLKQATPAKLPVLEENMGASMCFTSGTTGKPKGVIYSHRAIVLHSFAEAMPDAMAFSELDTTLQVSSMFHANGWGFPHTATMVGAKQVYGGPYADPEGLLDLMEQERVTLTNGVPTIWIGILEALEKNPGRWKLQPNLRSLGAGTAVPESVIRGLDKHGIRLLQLWGMTETTPMATVSVPSSEQKSWTEEKQYEIRARQGRPAPFLDLRAVNLDGEIPWDGKTLGELHVRGPWVAAEYYNFPESKDRWTADGWFQTGDVVSIHPDGNIKIADRSKDLIKSGGEWISSVDLENMLMGHPAVKEAAVVAIPHPKWAERPLAAVVLRDGAKASADDLRAFLSSQFAKWQLPEAIIFLDAIPKTSVGKFQKRELRERYKDWKWE